MNRIAITILAGWCAGGLAVLSLPAVAAKMSPSAGVANATSAAAAPPPPAMVDENTADKARSDSANVNSRPPAQTNPIEGDPELEPQVTLIERGDETHEEVRINGVIRYIKVTSKVGLVYYLVPVNGAAGAYVRRDSLESGLRVPMWEIFSW
ncbi:MAG: DUF2782 domain-containing protein [Burkholderiales bacterium]|jgi:hypothetical protein|nr:DUF2782 domain-containing protein [Burkholderiales bacterium]